MTPDPAADAFPGTVDAALADALERATGDLAATRDAEELAADAGVPVAVIEAVAREGLLTPVAGGDAAPRFRADDAEAVRAGVALLESGIPLGDLLDLARTSNEALRVVAAQAVDLFLAFVRDPAVAEELAGDREGAASEVVAAFERMLPAARALVANHLGRLVLDEARARLAADGAMPT